MIKFTKIRMKFSKIGPWVKNLHRPLALDSSIKSKVMNMGIKNKCRGVIVSFETNFNCFRLNWGCFGMGIQTLP